jgi:predicted RNA polymerase sigma factor
LLARLGRAAEAAAEYQAAQDLTDNQAQHRFLQLRRDEALAGR